MNKKMKLAGVLNLLSGIVGFCNMATYMMLPLLMATILGELSPNLAVIFALLSIFAIYFALILCVVQNGMSLALGFGLLTKPTMTKSLHANAKGIAIFNIVLIALWGFVLFGITVTIGWQEDIFNMVYTDKVAAPFWEELLLFADLLIKGIALFLNVKLLRGQK